MSQHPPHGSLPADWKSPFAVDLEPHRYCIACDEPGCTEKSPQSDAVYFEVGGEKMARALAEQNGWVRVRIDGQLRDLCPAHAPRRI